MFKSNDRAVAHRMYVEGIFDILLCLEVAEIPEFACRLIEDAFESAYKEGLADGQRSVDSAKP